MNSRDWGSDTLRRFRYQAEIAVPYCLAAASDMDGIAAVVPEHHEDIALDCGSSWRFLQVKSRDLDLGLWTLAQLLKKRGALRSLYRTHLCVGAQDHTLELVLEGAPKSTDLIMRLRKSEDHSVLVPQVASALQITEQAAGTFLDRVVLNGAPPPRDTIAARNRDLIHSQAPHLTWPEVEDLRERLLTAIERAMRADRIGPLWPRSIVRPSRRSAEVEARLEAKTLSGDLLRSILESSIGKPRPVLQRLVEPGGGPLTPLYRKLLVGGAEPTIIDQARNLQANARREHLTQSAQGKRLDSSLLDDLHQRIETHVTARVGIHADLQKPAPRIWADLVELFDSRAASIDQGGILRRDPMLLLGEACDLSDRCVFGWGEEAADEN